MKIKEKNILKHVEEYFKHVSEIHSSGISVPETSFYAPLQNLLNAVSQEQNVKIRCIIHLKNRGAGIPDAGLFTQDQLAAYHEQDIDFVATLPARGVIEIKSPQEDIEKTVHSEQVDKYFRFYRQVLITNYWDFLLIGEDAEGNKAPLERFRLADSATDFWHKASQSKVYAAQKALAFAEYLYRVFLHSACLVDPQEVARFLASYAKEAQFRLKDKNLPALDTLRVAFEEALGISFTQGKAAIFFRSTLIQTLFYGIFSAWVMWAKTSPPSDTRFHWRSAAWTLHVPMISALFEQVISPTKLRPLGLEEVLDWTTSALNRVNREEFFSRFAEGEAVQYFYEPFLHAFDPALRKAMGVWYTPPEIVRYMVERVDRALRSQLGIVDGLADDNVYVLDPCCGTGAYLVEVLRKIDRTLTEKGADALSRYDVKKAAMRRVCGFELLPAPYVVAHLQLGLLLQEMKTPLTMDNSGQSERVAVYLTNALTGWEEQKAIPKSLLPELDQERDAAERIKQKVPILVILGNPPYNAFAGVAPQEEQDLLNVYKDGLQKDWGIRKFNLDDLYVRFFRLAERRILKTGKGLVCFISNASYLNEASYVVMRKCLLDTFDDISLDNMNGDSRETGKLTPEGKPDPSVFSTKLNTAGIRVGTAVSLLVRTGKRTSPPAVQFRNFWGTQKRAQLLATLDMPENKGYLKARPEAFTRYAFRPLTISKYYKTWPKLTDLCAETPITGYKENRRFSMIINDKTLLIERMQKYFDKHISWESLQHTEPKLTSDAARYPAKATRERLLITKQFVESDIVRYVFHPFDVKWAYISKDRPLWNEPRPALKQHQFLGNRFLVSRPSAVSHNEGKPLYCHSVHADFDAIRGHTYHIPFQLYCDADNITHKDQLTFFSATGVHSRANLSAYAYKYLKTVYGVSLKALSEMQQMSIWFHALAVGYSPAYLTDNAAGMSADWPRIPLPPTKELLEASSALGHSIAMLLDVDAPMPQHIHNDYASLFSLVGCITALHADMPLMPEKNHLDLTAGWGYAGKDGVTMPGKGKIVERAYLPEEHGAIKAHVQKWGLSLEKSFLNLGTTTYDVYMNKHAFWQNIPKNVWEYSIGGYQIIKKWLSYRESTLLGRGLTSHETRYVTDMVRRLTVLRLLEEALDANYHAIIGA